MKRNKADRNINTRRLCGKKNIANKKYLIHTAKSRIIVEKKINNNVRPKLIEKLMAVNIIILLMSKSFV